LFQTNANHRDRRNIPKPHGNLFRASDNQFFSLRGIFPVSARSGLTEFFGQVFSFFF